MACAFFCLGCVYSLAMLSAISTFKVLGFNTSKVRSKINFHVDILTFLASRIMNAVNISFTWVLININV